MPVPRPILTLKTNGKSISGFSNNELVIYAQFNETLLSAMEKLNNFRINKINNLYNNKFQEIPKQMWNFQIKENITLFIDTPSNPFKESNHQSKCLI